MAVLSITRVELTAAMPHNREEMEASIADAPAVAPIIKGTGGIRKLRWAASNRGKRGGIRTVYFYHADPEAIYLLMTYAKADRDDLNPADMKALSRLVTEIKKGRKGK